MNTPHIHWKAASACLAGALLVNSCLFFPGFQESGGSDIPESSILQPTAEEILIPTEAPEPESDGVELPAVDLPDFSQYYVVNKAEYYLIFGFADLFVSKKYEFPDGSTVEYLGFLNLASFADQHTDVTTFKHPEVPLMLTGRGHGWVRVEIHGHGNVGSTVCFGEVPGVFEAIGALYAAPYCRLMVDVRTMWLPSNQIVKCEHTSGSFLTGYMDEFTSDQNEIGTIEFHPPNKYRDQGTDSLGGFVIAHDFLLTRFDPEDMYLNPGCGKIDMTNAPDVVDWWGLATPPSLRTPKP